VGKLEGIKDVFMLKGFNHQMSYANETARYTMLYAIGKIIQKLPLNEDGTCKS
jgi:hypothetical protein